MTGFPTSMDSTSDPLFLAFQGALAGRYSLLSELGRGGMGIVYLAHEVLLDRPVAIKLLPPDQDSAVRRERFLREARAAAQLSHPNIVPIHTVAEAGRFVFYAMAYVEGETLRATVERRGPLGGLEAASLVRDIARALGYAHARGIVHRDVKPDNILLERATGRALVSDFGIAQVAADGPTDPHHPIGTPEYMSPEQASGDPVDARSDLYALGAVAFFVLTGRAPFTGESAAAVMAQHISEPAPRLTSVLTNVPPRLAEVVDRCLDKDRTNRPESAEALAEQLGAVLERRKLLPAPLEAWIRSVDNLRFRHVAMAPGAALALFAAYSEWVYRLVCQYTNTGPCAPLPETTSFALYHLREFVIFVLPFVLYGAYRLGRVRHLLAQGFAIADLRSALQAQVRVLESASEGEVVAARVRESFMAAVFSTLAVSVLGTCYNGRADVASALLFVSWLGVVVVAHAPMYLRPAGRSALETDLRVRSRLWSGVLGRFVAWFAGLGLRLRSSSAPATHRPTELALGAAIAAVYEALPSGLRVLLPDVLDVVTHLEGQAGRLRGRVAELEAMCAQAGAGVGKAHRLTEDYHRQFAAELSGRRSAAERQLEAVVAALEILRLDLIRLRAGSVTADRITAALDAARRVGADVDVALDAKAEAEALLRAPTPA